MIIKITTLLCCFIMPMHSFGMKISQMKHKKTPVVNSHNPTTYQELIATLQNKQTVTITDFLRCLDDAKKHNVNLYFISQDLIDTSELKDQILALFQTNTSYFKAHQIKDGFICAVNKESYESHSSTVLTIQTKRPNLDEKKNILAKFNIERPTDKQIQQIDKQNILLFPFPATFALENLYNEIIAEGKRIEELAQEEKEAKETPSEPEKEILPEPIVEIVQPEKQQEQIALVEKYSPLIKQIQLMGTVTGELKNKANEWIKKLNTGSLEKSEIDQAQKFFTDLETKVKKIKEEAAVPTAQKIIEPPKKISYMDLITRLQNNETITISDFLQYLNDAKEQKLAFYFISDDFINSRSEKLKDNILALFEISISNSDIFKDETTGNVLFKAYAVPGGFVCLINISFYMNNYNNSSTMLTQEIKPNLEKKLALLSTFNIKKASKNEPVQQIADNSILYFPLAANTEIEGLYDTVIAEFKKIEELIEQKLALKKTSLEPEITVEKEKTESIITQPPQSLNTPKKGIDIYTIPLG